MYSRTILLIVMAGLFLGGLLAQAPLTRTYRSPLLGQTVADPESLSGLWEAPDGQGGAVGLHLQLMTTVPADATTLSGVTQSWFSLQVGVYQRKNATIQFGEENFFVDSYPGSNMQFDRGRLTLHFAPTHAGLPTVDLDLVQRPGIGWEGNFHQGDFDHRLKLLRPGAGKGGTVDPAVGTWLEDRGNFPVSRFCLHLAQQTATEWTGWADSLMVPGDFAYPPHISRPATATENYGELIKVQRTQDHSLSFELGAYNSVCCPHTFLGAADAAGTSLKGAWPAGPNQAPHPGSWSKMPRDSCLDPKSVRQ